MSATQTWTITFAAIAACLFPRAAAAAVTVYFNPTQVATPEVTGPTWDTISCEGYLFTYTRDKLFTGGGSEPIGRPVRVPWPDGVEAQYVTSGPNPGNAKITVQRMDGGLFDLTSFTAMLLANAGAGRAIEIVPLLGGQEPLNDPLFFDVSGYYGNEFSYDTSPNPLGSTAALVDYDAYVINLTLDYALTALTLSHQAQVSVGETEPRTRSAAHLLLSPNPAGSRVEISRSGGTPVSGARVSIYSVGGACVYSLLLDASGRATWNLRDEHGRPVSAGVYFARTEARGGVLELQRLVVVR